MTRSSDSKGLFVPPKLLAVNNNNNNNNLKSSWAVALTQSQLVDTTMIEQRNDCPAHYK